MPHYHLDESRRRGSTPPVGHVIGVRLRPRLVSVRVAVSACRLGNEVIDSGRRGASSGRPHDWVGRMDVTRGETGGREYYVYIYGEIWARWHTPGRSTVEVWDGRGWLFEIVLVWVYHDLRFSSSEVVLHALRLSWSNFSLTLSWSDIVLVWHYPALRLSWFKSILMR